MYSAPGQDAQIAERMHDKAIVAADLSIPPRACANARRLALPLSIRLRTARLQKPTVRPHLSRLLQRHGYIGPPPDALERDPDSFLRSSAPTVNSIRSLCPTAPGGTLVYSTCSLEHIETKVLKFVPTSTSESRKHIRSTQRCAVGRTLNRARPNPGGALQLGYTR